jgi:fibronectin type 3 domain-containing protein
VQLDKVTSNYTGTGTLTYSWSPMAGLNNSSIANPIATVAQPQTFRVSITTPNGCIASDSVIVNVQPLTVDAGADKSHVCGDSIKLADVKSNYTGTAPLTYSWQPTTGLNNANIANPVSGIGSGSYVLTIISQNGCKTSDEIKINLTKREAIEICIVGSDTSGDNKIIWDHPASTAIDSVFIYKENGINNFVKIASVAYSKGQFVDNTSQPGAKSDRYTISILDDCGLESAQSIAHKTMYLSVSKGIGTTWSLTWDAYEGYAVRAYNIYRGKDKSSLVQYGQVSGATQFTDLSPPAGTVYYQVEAEKPQTCDASGVSLRSNVGSNNPVGIVEFSNELNFSMYPNPANGSITLKFENQINKGMTLTLYNAIGEIVKTIAFQQNQQQMDVNDLSNGLYFVELKSGSEHSIQKLIIEK